MEINITKFVLDVLGGHIDTRTFSDSVSRSGLSNIAEITWRNALTCKAYSFVSAENVEDVKDHFREYGAWSNQEIDNWTGQEVNALILQELSSALDWYLDHGTDDDGEIIWDSEDAEGIDIYLVGNEFFAYFSV